MKKPWFYILLSLAAGDRYGTQIQDDVRTLSEDEVRLWPATLYGSLEELLEEGWIRELAPSEEPKGASRRSRYYRLRPEGREALEAEVARTEAVAQVARNRLEAGQT